MTTPMTLPHLDVVKELWDGAPVRATWHENDSLVTLEGVWFDGQVAAAGDLHEAPYEHHPGEGVWLRLDDPLRLGLHGLRAQLAERVGAGVWMPKWVRDLVDGPERWDDLDDEQVVTVSTALARTDALFAAVGLPLELGEVGVWERYADGWSLEATSGGALFYPDANPDDEYVVPGIDGITGRLAALEAALAGLAVALLEAGGAS